LTAQWTEALTPYEPGRLLAYVAVFSVCYYVVFFPLHLYADLFLERRFGLSKLRLGGWAVREAKRVVLSAGFGLLLIEGLYAVLRSMPAVWPLVATAGWVIVSIVLVRIFPTVLLPLFYKTIPLQDDELVQRLTDLCRCVGLSVVGVFRVNLGVETRKANAALAGLGRTRRVLLSDTLLEHFAPEEIETVLAHELGHQRYRHITQMLVISAIGTWLAFSVVALTSAWWVQRWGLRGLDDLAGFPMLMLSLSVIGLVGLPLQNALSRHFEWQADRFAVSTTTRAQAFASALKKLGQLNLADPNPPRWIAWLFYDHPPITQRIHAAEVAG